MSDTAIGIAIVGATGAAGGQLLQALHGGPLSIQQVHAYASRTTRFDVVEFGGREVSVEDTADFDPSGVRLIFSCLAPNVARRTVPALLGRGPLLIDVGNATAGEYPLPLVLPGVRMAEPEDVASAGGVRTPSAAGWMLATLLAPLRAAGLSHATGVLSLPASAFGREGIAELGDQVVALFNTKDAPRRVFPEGLAFDTLVDDVPEEEWSSAEQLARAEVQELAGVSAAVQVVTQPLFHGMSVGLHLRGLEAEAVEDALRDAAGLTRVGRAARFRPRAMLGKRGVCWGMVRPDPSGDGAHIWAVADNLGGAAGGAPAAVAAWMQEQGLLYRGEA